MVQNLHAFLLCRIVTAGTAGKFIFPFQLLLLFFPAHKGRSDFLFDSNASTGSEGRRKVRSNIKLNKAPENRITDRNNADSIGRASASVVGAATFHSINAVHGNGKTECSEVN